MKTLIVLLFLVSIPAFSSNDPEEEFVRTGGGSDVGTGEGDLFCPMAVDGKYAVLPDGTMVPLSWAQYSGCRSLESY